MLKELGEWSVIIAEIGVLLFWFWFLAGLEEIILRKSLVMAVRKERISSSLQGGRAQSNG